jgi:hypothetical protein
MSTELVFVLVAVALLVSFAYLGTRRAKGSPDLGQALAAIQALDIEAFRNLMDPEEEAFLRAQLPVQEFRTLRRERVRAALAYVSELSRASLQFARFGDAAKRSSDPSVAASGRQIANGAISLRMLALNARVRLTLAAVFPGLDTSSVRPLIDRYNQAAGLLQDLSGRTPDLRETA